MTLTTSPTTGGAALIDTKRVADRRTLRFDSITQCLAEVDRLANLEREGKLTRLGNWTLGQTLGHMATWAEFAFDPCPLHPPLAIRIVMKFMKKKFLRDPMPAGFRMPKIAEGTL